MGTAAIAVRALHRRAVFGRLLVGLTLVCGCSEKSPTMELALDAGPVDSSRDVVSGDGPRDLSGTPCDYLCGGFACNLTCEGNVLYRCGESNLWSQEEDCSEDGLRCELVGDEPSNFDRRCVDPPDAGDGGSPPNGADASASCARLADVPVE